MRKRCQSINVDVDVDVDVLCCLDVRNKSLPKFFFVVVVIQDSGLNFFQKPDNYESFKLAIPAPIEV